MNINYIDENSITNFLNQNGIICEFIDVNISCNYTIYNFKYLIFPKNSIIKNCILNFKRFTGREVVFNDGFCPSSFQIKITNLERLKVPFSNYCQQLASAPAYSIALGVKEDNTLLTASLFETKSIFIGGSSGGGKSVALHNIITSLICYNNIYLSFIDLKCCEFEFYKNLKNLVSPVANTFAGAIKNLNKINDIIDTRYKKMKKLKIRTAPVDEFTPIVCFIDEYALLTSIDQKQVDSLVSRIASVGRACNVFIVVATQHAVNGTISNTIRSNLQSRIGLRCTNTAQSMNIIGSGVLTELLGCGDSYISIDGRPKLERTQILYLSDNDLNNIYN